MIIAKNRNTEVRGTNSPCARHVERRNLAIQLPDRHVSIKYTSSWMYTILCCCMSQSGGKHREIYGEGPKSIGNFWGLNEARSVVGLILAIFRTVLRGMLLLLQYWSVDNRSFSFRENESSRTKLRAWFFCLEFPVLQSLLTNHPWILERMQTARYVRFVRRSTQAHKQQSKSRQWRLSTMITHDLW